MNDSTEQLRDEVATLKERVAKLEAELATLKLKHECALALLRQAFEAAGGVEPNG